MAVPANKASALLSSSSSPSIPGKQNPRPRNSESGDPMRRSFERNPFHCNKPTVLANPRGFHNPSPTPANSPSDFPRRNSIGKESARRDFHDKENEKDQISNRARAPPTPKGSKKFMSPTISAASKMNASPRKKVLAEKNEGTRTSVSFSDVRSLIMEDNRKQPTPRPSVSFSEVISVIGEDNEEPMPQMGSDEKKHLEESYDMTVTDLNQKGALESESTAVSEPNKTAVNEEKGSVNCDPSFKISPRPSVVYTSPMVAPLDADPLMPPYDPKKNYLSPRPQFLHYRPNPRIEHYLNEGKQLEEIFTSESSSDTEVSEEETHSENSEKQLEEDASQESATEEEKVVVEDDDDEGTEPQSTEQLLSEHTEADGTSKPRRFRTFKFLGWLLVLAVAYFAVVATFSPSSELSMLKYSGFYDFHVPPAFTEFAKANCEKLGEKIRMWSKSSLACIRKLISSQGEEEQIGQQQFYNSTDFWEDESFDTQFQPARAEAIVAESNHQEYKRVEKPIEEEGDLQESEEPLKLEIGGQKNFRAVPEEDGQAETYDVEEKSGEDKNYGAFSEKYIDEEIQEFQEEIEMEMSKHDEEKPERIESAATYSLQDTEVIGGENNFEAVSEEDGDAETHDVEQKSGGEKDSEACSAKESDAEAHEFQQEIDAKASKNDEEKLERIEPASTYKDQPNTEAHVKKSAAIHDDQQEETKSHVKRSADNFKSDPDHDVMKVIGQLVHVSEEREGTVEVDLFETSEVEDDDRHEVSADVSQISVGKLLTNWNVLALSSSTVLVLLAALALLFTKAKPVTPNAAASASEQTPVTKELNYPPVSVENLIKERLSSLNFQIEVDDAVGESCPSYMSSSFQKSSSLYSNKDLKESSEAQSRERRNIRKSSSSGNFRRESLASSASEYSIDSASYGSFTTYEKIPVRSGHRDEEAITPVRRSSRLRNQLSGQ